MGKISLNPVEISEETKARTTLGEIMHKKPHKTDHSDESNSKNNKDIGRTTLIKMEIDTGDSLPVAQNPYTLPLKHHE